LLKFSYGQRLQFLVIYFTELSFDLQMLIFRFFD